MSIKKGAVPGEGISPLIQQHSSSPDMNTIPYWEGNAIKIYPMGVTTSWPMAAYKPDNSGGDRGQITGWSKASRRRMRKWLMTHYGLGTCYGVTLTIPGPIITQDEWQTLLNRLSTQLKRTNMGMVWRLELQTRGQPHLHGIITVMGAGASAEQAPHLFEFELRHLWLGLIDKHLSRVSGILNIPGRGLIDCKDAPRSLLPGVDRYAVDVTEDTGTGVWLRYLVDHTTKAKQAQISTWTGCRHWGVINRSAFAEVLPETLRLDRYSYNRCYRWLRRLSRRRVKANCVFGYKSAPSPRRNSAGRADWFGVSASDALRLAELAQYARDSKPSPMEAELPEPPPRP